MPAYIGSHKIDKCYLGSQEISKVMLGTHEVCSSSSQDGLLCDQPGAINSGFLKCYDSQDRVDLPSHRIYPMGQKMMFAEWNAGTNAQIDKMATYKLNTLGPLQGYFDQAGEVPGTTVDSAVNRAISHGIRLWLVVRNEVLGQGIGIPSQLCPHLHESDAEQIRVGEKWLNWYIKTNFVGNIDAWLISPEEVCGRMDTSCMLTPSDKVRIEEILELYINRLIIRDDADRKERLPIIRSETEALTYITQDNLDEHLIYNRRIYNVAMQHYVDRDGPSGSMPRLWWNLDNTVKQVVMLEAENPDESGHVRTGHSILSYIYADTGSDSFWRLLCRNNIWMVLLKGLKHLSVYRATQKSEFNPISGSRLVMQDAYYGTIKEIVDNGFDVAFMWGKPGGYSPLTITHTGSAEYLWMHSNSLNKDLYVPRILKADLQYGNKRYIVVLNMHNTVSSTITISGLPVGEKIRNCKTGHESDITSSTMNFSLPAWEVDFFVVFSDSIVIENPPVITSHPVGGTFAVGAATPTFTVGYTPSTAHVQWQWQNLEATTPVPWRDIAGANSATYSMTATHIAAGHDGDEFRAQVSTSGNPIATSNIAHITVTGG